MKEQHIGYGKNRPLSVLSKNSPGFQESTGEKDKGTFYSSLINADIKIEDGNPNASAIRVQGAVSLR